MTRIVSQKEGFSELVFNWGWGGEWTKAILHRILCTGTCKPEVGGWGGGSIQGRVVLFLLTRGWDFRGCACLDPSLAPYQLLPVLWFPGPTQ